MNNTYPPPAIRVQQLLAFAQLSRRAAAEELQVEEQTLRSWCSGEAEPPRMAILALERLIDLVREDVISSSRLVELMAD